MTATDNLPRKGWASGRRVGSPEVVTGDYRGAYDANTDLGEIAVPGVGRVTVLTATVKLEPPVLWWSPSVGLIELRRTADTPNGYMVTMDGSYSRVVRELPADVEPFVSRPRFVAQISETLLAKRDQVASNLADNPARRGRRGGLEEAAGIVRGLGEAE